MTVTEVSVRRLLDVTREACDGVTCARALHVGFC